MIVYRIGMFVLLSLVTGFAGLIIYATKFDQVFQQNVEHELSPVPSVIAGLSWFSYLSAPREFADDDGSQSMQGALSRVIDDLKTFDQSELTTSQYDFLQRLQAWFAEEATLPQPTALDDQMTASLVIWWQEAARTFPESIDMQFAAVSGLASLKDLNAFDASAKKSLHNMVTSLLEQYPNDNRVYELAVSHLTGSPDEIVKVFLNCLRNMPEQAYCYERYHETLQDHLALGCKKEHLAADLSMTVAFVAEEAFEQARSFQVGDVQYMISEDAVITKKDLEAVVIKPAVPSSEGVWPGAIEVKLTNEAAHMLYEVSQSFIGQRLAVTAGNAVVAAPVIAGPINAAEGVLSINVTEAFIEKLQGVCPSVALPAVPTELYLDLSRG